MSLKLEKLSVLIVEDTEALRKLIVSLMLALGVGKVLDTSNGEDGFKVFCQSKPDIVIADWYLPGMSGLELTDLIRKSSVSSDRMVPIIMMTGYSSAEKITLARDKGVTEYLVKPFTSEDFIKRLFYVIQSPRDFIDCDAYFGPDRRRTKMQDYKGLMRRADDKMVARERR